MENETFFLAVPLGVIREFVKQNKNEPDNFIQLFELEPSRIFTEEEIKSVTELQRKGVVIVQEDGFSKGGKDDK